MSDRLCCYQQQRHPKLLAQFMFKVSAFRFNARTKMHVPQPDCRINNVLITYSLGAGAELKGDAVVGLCKIYIAFARFI